ncbi:DUF6114 domain-containing protein [Streptomyces sp. NPDC088812]|uniref:DUF6114 domain-containing protein n=1 Tax=Streptomyces sp. NPDC088812 TaxID=3365905 RepID=UPI00381EBDC0
MFSFVFGFLSELARETGDWFDRILPAPRLRRSLRGWRRRRPFWAAVWVIAGGVEMVAIPLAPLPLMIRIGVGAMSAAGISLVLIAGGLFFLFKPDQRMFVSVVTAIASLTSMATTNLGGFGIGMLAGLIGSSMAFGWMPDPERTTDGERTGDGDGPDARSGPPDAERDARPATAVTAATVPVAAETADAVTGGADARGEGTAPKAREGRARSGGRPGPVRGAVLFVVSAVVAAGLPAAGTAAAAPGTDVFPLPWPTLTWPWESAGTPSPTPAPTGSASGGRASGSTGPAAPTPTTSGSTSPSTPPAPEEDDGKATEEEAGEEEEKADAAQVTLPCLTGVDTGGLPDPDQELAEATPGETADDPDDLTALRPPIVIGDQPGRPRATYPISPLYPEVGADTLTAYGAIIHGATYLPTADGRRMKVLWVHADRLVADDYAFRLESAGQVQTIDVDLDIPQVDIYVTQLTGSITIPVLEVGTPRICIGADVVPANLPIAVQLPKLSVTAVEAGQVLVDAETVHFADLSIRSRHR